MASSNKATVEYKEKIVELRLSQIDVNNLNPRKRFVDTEGDVLIESILSKGLLNPIIVFKRKKDNRYVILDGERRFRAFEKLNYKVISCHVLEKEPTDLENLSLMFHIHNVREEWTDFAIAQTLVKVIYEMGKNIKKLNRKDRIEISRLTSLSEYKIKKYLVFYDYPQAIIDKFMQSELKEVPDKGMDPDILAEMHQPIKLIETEIPELLNKYSIETIIDSCIRKKEHEIIKTNRDFRLLAKSLVAVQKGSVRKELMLDKLEGFITELEVTPQNIYDETSGMVYQIESILRKAEQLIYELQNLNLNQLTKEEKRKLGDNLSQLTRLLQDKVG